MREDDAAPGIEKAISSSFLSPALNDAGEVAFRAGVQGTGIDLANNIGPFKADGLGVLDLVVRLGDQIDIGGGELRTITALSFLPRGFNDNGALAFLAEFFDGQAADGSDIFRNGIFVTEAAPRMPAVPLPPALGLMLFGVAALGFAGRRRSRGTSSVRPPFPPKFPPPSPAGGAGRRRCGSRSAR